MRLIQVTPLPPDADAADLCAVLACAIAGRSVLARPWRRSRCNASARGCSGPGGALADPPGAPPGRPGLLTGSAAAIGERILSGKARSAYAAALQLAYAGKLPGGGTPKSKAHYHSRLYRAAHCKLKATAFDLQKTPNTGSSRHAILLSEHREPEMEPKNSKALAPDKLILTSCRPPKSWLINLDTEGLSDATRAEILDPLFWQEAHGAIRQGDIVSLTSAIGENLDILVGPETADGFRVAVLSEHAVHPGKSTATFTQAAA